MPVKQQTFRAHCPMKKPNNRDVLHGMYRVSSMCGPDTIFLRSYSRCFLKDDGTPSPMAVKAVRAACGEEGVMHLLAGRLMHMHVRTDMSGNMLAMAHLPLNLEKMHQNPTDKRQ